jgi:hypothetical protein
MEIMRSCGIRASVTSDATEMDSDMKQMMNARDQLLSKKERPPSPSDGATTNTFGFTSWSQATRFLKMLHTRLPEKEALHLIQYALIKQLGSGKTNEKWLFEIVVPPNAQTGQRIDPSGFVMSRVDDRARPAQHDAISLPLRVPADEEWRIARITAPDSFPDIALQLFVDSNPQSEIYASDVFVYREGVEPPMSNAWSLMPLRGEVTLTATLMQNTEDKPTRVRFCLEVWKMKLPRR